MEGVALIPGLYASTKDKRRYKRIILTATTVDGLLTIMVSVISYLAYGPFTREIVLMNLSYGIMSNIV